MAQVTALSLGGVWPDPAQHPGGHHRYQQAPGEGLRGPGLHVGRAVRGIMEHLWRQSWF